MHNYIYFGIQCALLQCTHICYCGLCLWFDHVAAAVAAAAAVVVAAVVAAVVVAAVAAVVVAVVAAGVAATAPVS